MNKYLLIFILTLTSCGSETDEIPTESPTPTTPTASTSIEGYYLLPNGGFLELVELEDKRIVIYGAQRIFSQNTGSSKSYGLHPNITVGPHTLKDGAIASYYNTTYVSTTHNLRRDGSNSFVTGSRHTNYKIFKDGNGKLNIQLIIYATTSPFTIHINRTIKEL